MTHEDGPATLGAVIRRRRLELGWSQDELADRASGGGDEVRQSDISRLECGRVGLPRRPRLVRIAAALGMTPGELLARSGWARASGAAAGNPALPPTGDPPAATAPLPLPPAPALPGLALSGDAAAQSVRQLRRAIDDAEQTRARTEQLLRRAGEVYALASCPRGAAPARERATWDEEPDR